MARVSDDFDCADKSKRNITDQLHICIYVKASRVADAKEINKNSMIRDTSKSWLHK